MTRDEIRLSIFAAVDALDYDGLADIYSILFPDKIEHKGDGVFETVEDEG